MISSEVYCPEPCIDCPEIVDEECGVSKTVIWSTDSTQQVFFYVENINLRVIGFKFTPILNNGSVIEVKLKYYRGSDYVTAQTFQLSTLPLETTKYHYIDLGPNLPENTYLQLEITTSDGTSGRFSVQLNCNVNISSRDFCYVTESVNPFNLCSKCPTQLKVYWEQLDPNNILFFRYNNWFLDPTLQTPAPAGYYMLLNDTSKQVYYFDGTNARKNNNCDCSNLDCPVTTSLSHVKVDYKFSTPYIEGLESYPVSSLKYSVKCTTVNLNTTDYGYVTILFTVSGSREDAAFTVQDVTMANGGVGFLSYSSDTTGRMFYPISNLTIFRPKKGQNTFRVNIMVNGTSNSTTRTLLIRGSVGQKTKYKSKNTVTTQFEVSCPTPLYKYNVGLHTYSAYDSYYNPKLTTTLYSRSPINTWSEKTTLIFNDPQLSHPALPWYYGYSGNSKVYKVGIQYDRAFGTKKKYKVKTNLARKFVKWIGLAKESFKIDTIIEGPKKWDGTSQYRVPACIETIMDPGYIRYIYNAASLPQPTSYRYYTGIGPSQLEANDSVFTTYNFGEGNHYGITGYEHALGKIIQGYISGLQNNVTGPNLYLSNGELSAFAAAGLGFSAVAISVGITVKLVGLLGPSLPLFVNCPPVFTVGVTASASLGPVGAIILLAVLLGFTLYALFKTTTEVWEETCREFILLFCDSPYIELGEILYGTPNFTGKITNTYIVDGAYSYLAALSTGVIVRKDKSYTDQWEGRVYSILPDVPRNVTEIPKLFFLPYTSGVPVEYATPQTTFKSESVSVSILPSNVGALNNPLPITFTLPSGLTESNSSQQDANDDAILFLSGLTASTESTWISSEQKPSISAHTMTFTHEFKFENPSANFDVAYDNVDGSGITVNKILYYDINGRYSVLDGYYSKNADDGINYKKFYQTSAGTVVDIYTMSSSTANSVQSQQTATIYPISTGYTGYTSSWYIASPIIEDTFYHEVNNINNFNNIWNTTEFYSNPVIRRGFTNTPIAIKETYLYSSNTSLDTFELSPSLWYKEIPEVYNQQPYLYSTGDTIYIDFEQYCADDDTNGLYIICKDDDGDEISSFVGLSISFDVVLSLNDEDVNPNITYNATMQSYESRTFVELPQSYINNIESILINEVYGQNPNYNFFFTTGNTSLCFAATPTPSPQEFTPTPELTPTQTQTPTMTPTPTSTSAPTYIQFTLANPQSDECVACGLNTYPVTGYTSPTNTIPEVGDVVYTNSGLTTTLNGVNQWWKTTWGLPTVYSVQINGSGQVTSVKDCSTCPTLTPTPTISLTPTQTPTVTPTSATPTPTPSITPTNAVLCDDMFNNTGNPLNGINYTDCGGTPFTNATVNPGDSICVQQGTLGGGDSGFLINLGNC